MGSIWTDMRYLDSFHDRPGSTLHSRLYFRLPNKHPNSWRINLVLPPRNLSVDGAIPRSTIHQCFRPTHPHSRSPPPCHRHHTLPRTPYIHLSTLVWRCNGLALGCWIHQVLDSAGEGITMGGEEGQAPRENPLLCQCGSEDVWTIWSSADVTGKCGDGQPKKKFQCLLAKCMHSDRSI